MRSLRGEELGVARRMLVESNRYLIELELVRRI